MSFLLEFCLTCLSKLVGYFTSRIHVEEKFLIPYQFGLSFWDVHAS